MYSLSKSESFSTTTGTLAAALCVWPGDLLPDVRGVCRLDALGRRLALLAELARCLPVDCGNVLEARLPAGGATAVGLGS